MSSPDLEPLIRDPTNCYDPEKPNPAQLDPDRKNNNWFNKSKKLEHVTKTKHDHKKKTRPRCLSTVSIHRVHRPSHPSNHTPVTSLSIRQSHRLGFTDAVSEFNQVKTSSQAAKPKEQKKQDKKTLFKSLTD